MNIVLKNIWNCRCNLFKEIPLRLSTIPKCTICANGYAQKRMLSITYQNIIQKDKYTFTRRMYTKEAVALQENEYDFIKKKRRFEHESMHEIIKNSESYRNSIMQPLKVKRIVDDLEIEALKKSDWSVMTADEIYKGMKNLAYCYMNNVYFEPELYSNVSESCISKLPEFSDTRIKNLMQYLILMQGKMRLSRPYNRFMKALNKECIRRFYSSDISEIFSILDGFYQLNEWKGNYMWRTIRKIGSKTYKLEPKQLVQLMFYLSICRSYDINMYEIECRLEECVPDLSVFELGIIARGFFMSQKQIHSKKLLEVVILKLINNLDKVNDICLAAIMKLLRYSDCCHCLKLSCELFDRVQLELPRLSLLSLVHISHTCGSIRLYNKDLLNSILERLTNEINEARLKDFERVLFTICTLSPPAEKYPAIDIIINKLSETYKTTRAAEIEKYPKSFVRIILFLTLKNIYLPEFIEYIFNERFVQNFHQNNMFNLTSELLDLHCNVQINLPTYQGPLLNDKVYNCLIKKFCVKQDVHKREKGVQLQMEVTYILKEKLGLIVHSDIVLPHFFTRDIICAMDENNNSIDLGHILSEMPTGTIKRVNNFKEIDGKKINWKILYLISQMHLVIGHDGYHNYINSKIKQLELIGFQPLLVHQSRWTFLNEDQKYTYLKKLIF